MLEMIVAMLMLVVFTSIVVSVMHFSLRFLGEAESSAMNFEPTKPHCTDADSGETIDTQDQPCEPHNGILIDHQDIRIAMDALVEVLSQPGINVGDIALPLKDSKPVRDCVFNPVKEWYLPMSEVSLPPGYRMCLWKTLVDEITPPGIYMLQALPEKLGPSGLPVRRLFCRPRPDC